MEKLTIKKWGNSNGLRIPKNVMDYLGVHAEDTVTYKIEEQEGLKRLVIEVPVTTNENELTIEELFKGYNEEPFHTELNDLGEARGHEKW